MRTVVVAFVLACSTGVAHGGLVPGADPYAEAGDSADDLVDYFLVADEIVATRGETVDVRVFLSAPEPSRVVATTHDLEFDRQAMVAADDGMRAECAINSDIERPSGFSFGPFGCDPQRACTYVRVLFLGVGEPPIPDRTPLYTCRVAISPRARLGWHPLRIRNVTLYSADGGEVVVRNVDGGIAVVDDGTTMANSDTDGCQIASGPPHSPSGVSWPFGVLVVLAVGRWARTGRASRRETPTVVATAP